MLIDPISGMRMVRAKAGGGVFWYCKHSRARLLTVVCAKKFLGEDGTREIWVRAGLSQNASEYACPSCTKPMRLVDKPKWLGGGQIDVCRTCHLIWIKPDEHPEVPHPEDLIVPQGDSTIVKDAGDASIEYAKQKQATEDDKDSMLGDGPDQLSRRVSAFFLLPAEMSEHGIPKEAIVSWILMAIMAIVFFKYTGPLTYEVFGFYPNDPLKNGGLNIITNAFIHGGGFHLLFNLYFFNMFSDDVENDLGPIKYLGFILCCLFLVAMFNFTLAKGASRTVPHVGISGVVMALMAYYALQFPKSRLAYLIPALHTVEFAKGGFAFVRGLRWLRVSVWSVFVFYILKDYLFYKYAGNDGVSHSGHLGGAIAGVILWFFFSKKPSPNRDIEITGEREKTPGYFLNRG